MNTDVVVEIAQEAERRLAARLGAYEDRIVSALYPEGAPPSAAARALDPHNPYLESVKEVRWALFSLKVRDIARTHAARQHSPSQAD